MKGHILFPIVTNKEIKPKSVVKILNQCIDNPQHNVFAFQVNY